MIPEDIKSSLFIDSSKETNHKDPKFKIGDIVRISKYKNIFAKGYVLNRSEKFLRLKKLKILCHGHMSLVILKAKKLLECLVKINSKKYVFQNQNLQADE